MTTTTVYALTANDNAYERGTGVVTVGDNKTYIYSNTNASSSSYICTGARCSNVTIAQGATIVTAYARFVANYLSENNANFTLYAEDVDTAVDFVSDAHVISRTRTTASVSYVYNSLAMDWFGADQEIKTIIQEIVDRPGWVAGNAICLLLVGNTNSNKTLRISTDDDGTHGDGPELYIEYINPTPPTPTASTARALVYHSRVS